MKKLLFKFVCFYLIGTPLIENKKVQAFIPHYYFPSSKNLKKEADSIGKNAYQLLYFGQIKDSLKVAKLAVKVNKSDEAIPKAWINNLNNESLKWDDKKWDDNLKGTTLKRIKPWMWKRNIKANLVN